MTTDPQFHPIHPNRIAPGVTDISLGNVPEPLKDSIGGIGITHPLILLPEETGYRIICGHRRWRIATDAGISSVPARVLPQDTSLEEQWCLFLLENGAHRRFSDPEIVRILSRLKESGIEDDRLVDQYMPILGLERSKKILGDCLLAGSFPIELQTALHELNAPLRAFGSLLHWREEDRREAHTLIGLLRPGVNKLRDLLEMTDEVSSRDGIYPEELWKRQEFRSALEHEDPAQRYPRFITALLALRFPNLSQLRKEVWLALDKLDLHPRTKIRMDENFEKDDLRVELNFRTLAELESQLGKLDLAAKSDAMKRLIETFRGLSGSNPSVK